MILFCFLVFLPIQALDNSPDSLGKAKQKDYHTDFTNLLSSEHLIQGDYRFTTSVIPSVDETTVLPTVADREASSDPDRGPRNPVATDNFLVEPTRGPDLDHVSPRRNADLPTPGGFSSQTESAKTNRRIPLATSTSVDESSKIFERDVDRQRATTAEQSSHRLPSNHSIPSSLADDAQNMTSENDTASYAQNWTSPDGTAQSTPTSARLVYLNRNSTTDESNSTLTAELYYGVVNSTTTSSEWDDRTMIYIGGLFELSGQYRGNGLSELASARMAIEDVNRQNYIPGYKLDMFSNDTKCEQGAGIDALYDFLYRKPQLLMVIGSACSSVTQTVAQLVSNWNLLQISFAATSPALSSTRYYPDFYRLAAADSSHNTARRLFIQQFKWRIVATLTQDKEVYTLAMSGMSAEFEEAGISIKASPTFRSTSKHDLRLKIQHLLGTDARILIGSFSETAARHVFCEAFQAGLYGPRYVWLLLDPYRSGWWRLVNDTNCTEQQLAQAVNYHFSVDALNTLLGDKRAISGLTWSEFVHEYEARGLPAPRSPFSPQTYDTIWTVAEALRTSLQLGNRPEKFRYRTGLRFKNQLKRIIAHMEFFGISGRITFDGPDRLGITVLEQNQGGRMVRLAVVEPEREVLDFNCEGCEPVVWNGGRIPVDNITITSYLDTIDSLAFLTVTTICSIGIVQALGFLAFNLIYRKLRYIKLSSPRLNNVALIGCILVYGAVILLGFDDRNMEADKFPAVCTTRVSLFSGGFTMAFGAMFTKTYRVHHICSRVHNGVLKRKLLKDKQLLLMIGGLLVADSLVMAAWCLFDPMNRRVKQFPAQVSPSNPDLHLIPELSHCYSPHMDKWSGVLYAYKGVMLVFGLYMAWSTRRVKIHALNDSKYIGMNVYNVVVMSILVVFTSNVLSDEPTLTYVLVSSLIMTSTTLTVYLLFIPKIYEILKSGGNPVITSYGITVEANTRRFVRDDTREKYFRAGVQNRIFRSEIASLNHKVMQAECRLAGQPQPAPQPTVPPPGSRGVAGMKERAKQKLITEHRLRHSGPVQPGRTLAPPISHSPRRHIIYHHHHHGHSTTTSLTRSTSTDSIDDETDFTEVEALKEEVSERLWPRLREQIPAFSPSRWSARRSLGNISRLYNSGSERAEVMGLLNEDSDQIELKHFNSDPALLHPERVQVTYRPVPARTLSGGWRPLQKNGRLPASRTSSTSSAGKESGRRYASKPKRGMTRSQSDSQTRPDAMTRARQQELPTLRRELTCLESVKCDIDSV